MTIAARFFIAAGLLLAGARVQGQDTPDFVWKKTGHTDHLHATIFTPDGKTLVTAGGDRLIKFWRVSDGTLLRTLNSDVEPIYANGIEGLALSPDGTRMAAGSNSGLTLWRVSDGTRRTLMSQTGMVFGVHFSPDGSLLASGGDDGEIRIWRVADASLVTVLRGHTQRIRALSFTPDGRYVVSGAGDSLINVWKTADWSLHRSVRGHTAEIRGLAFSANGTLMASGGEDRDVQLWNTTDWTVTKTFKGHTGIISTVAISKNGNVIATADDVSVRLWNVADGTTLRHYTREVPEVGCISIFANDLFAFGRFDATIAVARMPGGTMPPPPPPPPETGAPYTITWQHEAGGIAHWTMDGARRVNATTMAGGPPAKTWRLVGFRDLNGDEQPDFLWQNHTAIAAWFLQQTNRLSAALLRTSSPAWHIMTMADFNSDGQVDCLWQNGKGQVAVSLLEGTNFVSTILLRNGIAVSGGWRAVGAADFNGDGETDILWQNNAGQLAVWFMNGTTFLNAAVVRPGYNAVPDWRLAGLGDVDGDGNTDFLWQHTGGQLAAWLMDGVTFVRSLSLNGAQPVVAGSRMVDVTK